MYREGKVYKVGNTKTEIYIMTHKEFTAPDLHEYIPLRVGAALSGDDFGYMRDDTGENISDKNPSYCELTGMYWVWKNSDCDVVGISHYRRYFEYDNDFLDEDTIGKILKGFDIIVPFSTYTKEGSIRNHYKAEHNIRDLEMIGAIIDEMCPEYKRAYDACLFGGFFNPFNMFVAKKEVYDSYCAWLFPILSELEKRVDVSDYDEYQSRVFGFISERMLRIWLMIQKLRVYEMKVTMIDPENAYNNDVIMKKKKRLIELSIQDIVTLYSGGAGADVVNYNPVAIDDVRIPVWICWWQGFENAPDVVKLCRASVYKNFDSELFNIIEINFNNMGDYIQFPEWIVGRFNNEDITMTQLSDMLRMALLYYYGGVWMDATYFIAKFIGKDHPIYKNGCYTIKLKSTTWKTDITSGRWSGNMLKFPKGHVLPRFVMNAFYYYYIQNEQSADYFMIDYFINIAYEHIAKVTEDIDMIDYSQPQALRMADHRNVAYDEEVYSKLTEDTDLFKLTYKDHIARQNIIGRDTLFGFLCREYGV